MNAIDNSNPDAGHVGEALPLMPGEKKYPAHFRLLLFVSGGVTLVDIVTKEIARTRLLPEHIPRNLVGEVLRFTLVYNPGAAFGMNVGAYSRWVFTILTIGAMWILFRLYAATKDGERARVLALALVIGGAMGNLVNRLWSDRGVVDFLDVGIGALRWPTFNFADVGVSIGAFLLAWVLWGEDREQVRSDNSPLKG